MRVSSNQILEAGVQSMNNSLTDAMEWQKKIGTGNNYSKASDNPYAVSRGVRLEFDVARLDMYKSNQNFVASSHAIAQSQMGTIIDELIVLKQAFVQSQNGALNSSNFCESISLDRGKRLVSHAKSTRSGYCSTSNEITVAP